MKTFRKILATVMSLATLAGIVTLMLSLNDWGQSAPNDITQLFWAFSIVAWPVIVAHAIWPKD